VYTTVAALAHAITYFSEARERDVQLARISEQLATARFSALQAQVNPHFLFNTLNTITVLVRDGDQAGAVRIVEQLSEVLRGTLSRHRANEVTLEEEIELVRQYIAIEQARFSDRLRPTFRIGEGIAQAAVPSFAIQHLVENAIRHGSARREDAGQLGVGARRDGDWLEVTVTDDGPGIAVHEPPPGHGIANTQERLRMLYGERGTLTVMPVSGGGTIAVLRVPYREIIIEAAHAAG
jgi:LytS/YehU family sensor histidine kinase